MDKVVPWVELCALIELFCLKARPEGGRRPVGLGQVLRIHFLQQRCAFSDPTVEEAMYDATWIRRFVVIDLERDPAPGETTACRFRHLLEKRGLARELCKAVNRHLHDKGDATILGAPS